MTPAIVRRRFVSIKKRTHITFQRRFLLLPLDFYKRFSLQLRKKKPIIRRKNEIRGERMNGKAA